MSRCVQTSGLHLAQREDGSVLEGGDITGLHPGGMLEIKRDVRLVHVHRHPMGLFQLGRALDVESEEISAGVIGVPMGIERAGQGEPLGLDLVEQLLDVPGRVDEPGLPRYGVADQVGEVHHLGRTELVAGKIPPR